MHIWSKKDDPEFNKQFKNHTIAIDIIGQIVKQCERLRDYATSVNAGTVAQKYEEILDILSKIYEEVPKTKMKISEAEDNKFVIKMENIIKKRLESKAGKKAA